jgi:signal transduction histidine kinase
MELALWVPALSRLGKSRKACCGCKGNELNNSFPFFSCESGARQKFCLVGLAPDPGAWYNVGKCDRLGASVASVMPMWILSEVSKILSTSLGSLVYHLLLLLAVEAALAMAWGEWRRARNEQANRLCLAMGGLILMRVPYIVAALSASAGWINGTALLPPLERFADTASIGLLAWAFMPSAKGGEHTWDWILGANLGLAVIVCSGFVVLWSIALGNDPALDYNASWQAPVWSVWQGGLGVLACVAAIRSRNEGWGTFLLAMVVMFVGRILQWLYPAEVPGLPVWERLANLIAYPLITVAVYRDIVAGLHVHSRQLQDISQASLDQIKSLLFLFEAGQKMSASLALSSVLDNAVQGVARALEADQCAIAFPEEGERGQMRLLAIYNPARQGRGEGVTFPLEYQLTVQQAIRRRKYVIVEESDNVQLKVLFALLGSSEVGPLLVQPLVDEGEVIGTIIVGNARSRRPFTPNEAKLCQSMAGQVVGAIQNARRYQAVRDRIEELNKAREGDRRALQEAKVQIQEISRRLGEMQAENKKLHGRVELAREARNALEIKLVSSQAEADALSERLAVLETDLSQAHADADARLRWHEEELGRLQAKWQDASLVAGWSQAVLQGMTAGILATDAHGRIEETNVAAEILLDRTNEELQDLALTAVSEDERWQQAVNTALEGEAVRLTVQVGFNTLMCDIAPVSDPNMPQEGVLGLIAILLDVSIEVGEQRARLAAIAATADELRTPMTAIVNYTDLLLNEIEGTAMDTQRKFLLRIRASAERMLHIVDDLAQEAEDKDRWTYPQRQMVNIGELIETTVDRSRSQLEGKALHVELELAHELPPIQVDPDYLRRVLFNLLSNAYLASSVGGQIQVRAIQSDGLPPGREHLQLNGRGFVIVSVKDSGGGVSDDALSRVFDRERPSQTPPGLGESGAGLALVKTLIESHGGRLWVESESGVGTTFSFVLPVNQHLAPPSFVERDEVLAG